MKRTGSCGVGEGFWTLMHKVMHRRLWISEKSQRQHAVTNDGRNLGAEVGRVKFILQCSVTSAKRFCMMTLHPTWGREQSPLAERCKRAFLSLGGGQSPACGAPERSCHAPGVGMAASAPSALVGRAAQPMAKARCPAKASCGCAARDAASAPLNASSAPVVSRTAAVAAASR